MRSKCCILPILIHFGAWVRGTGALEADSDPQTHQRPSKASHPASKSAVTLLQLSEVVHADFQLPQKPVKERRADVASAVARNGDTQTLRNRPPFVASSLALTFKSQTRGNPAEFLSSAARHGRRRWCPRAGIVPYPGIRRQSSRKPVRVRPAPLPWLTSGRNSRKWQEFPLPSLPAGCGIRPPCNHPNSCLFLFYAAVAPISTHKREWIWRFMLTVCPYRTFGRSMTPNGHPGSVGMPPLSEPYEL